MKRVSLADVARAAGVGKATASRALSGRDEVGEATRARIAEIAASMGYQPHRGAQALRTGRFGVLAISLPLSEPYAGELLRGAAAEAGAHGFQLLVDAVGDAIGDAEAADARLDAMAVDGVVVVGRAATSPAVPSVGLDPAEPDPAASAAEAVARLLARLGVVTPARP
jgi:DNA-binding LacI/PurR family transcriptional regulator